MEQGSSVLYSSYLIRMCAARKSYKVVQFCAHLFCTFPWKSHYLRSHYLKKQASGSLSPFLIYSRHVSFTFCKAGKAAGKARKYVGKISSKLVRNIKGDGADVAFLQASQSFNHGRSPSSFDLGIQESMEFSGEDQAEEPLEKVRLHQDESPHLLHTQLAPCSTVLMPLQFSLDRLLSKEAFDLASVFCSAAGALRHVQRAWNSFAYVAS